MKINAQQKSRKWKGIVSPYEKANHKKSLWQLTNSIIPFLGLWYLAALSSTYAIWLTVVLAVMASGFFIRLFIIFHDCGHYAFLQNRRMNELVGTITGILTFFPYHKWRYEHAVHHATSSDLDHRGTGDIWILTVNEYRALTPVRRWIYRLYRNPFILFGFGPVYLFVNARFNRKTAGRRERLNTYLTNLILCGLMVICCYLFQWKTVLLVQGIILYVAGVVGIWLFYVQHQFEGSYFDSGSDWDYFQAALEGSSFYKLPKVLQWITGNIGFHHVHHLAPRIPNYYLQQVHEHDDSLRNVRAVDLGLSLKSLRYRLWDEEKREFVSFRNVKYSNDD